MSIHSIHTYERPLDYEVANESEATTVPDSTLTTAVTQAEQSTLSRMAANIVPQPFGPERVASGRRGRIARKAAALCMAVVAGVTGFVAKEAVEPAPSAAAVKQIAYDTRTGNYPYWSAVPTAQTVKDPSVSSYVYKSSISNPEGFDYRNCTDYVWWRVKQEFGASVAKKLKNGKWGHAKNWDNKARNTPGFQVDKSPEAGDVAVFEAGKYGHVEFVESVNADKTVNTAGYNKGYSGSFARRGEMYTTDKVNKPPRTIGGAVKADWYIDLNGPNAANPDFKLKYYAQGTQAPKSENEQTLERQARIFSSIADHQYVRIEDGGGTWFRKEGPYLQLVGWGDELAHANGWDVSPFTSKDSAYNLVFANKYYPEEQYPYEQRIEDAATGKLPLGQPIGGPITERQLRDLAETLGFDNLGIAYPDISHGDFIPDARDMKFFTYENCGYDGQVWYCTSGGFSTMSNINMDLVAQLISDRDDVIAYPQDWEDYRTWHIYQRPAGR